jgi:hypothetical protein
MVDTTTTNYIRSKSFVEDQRGLLQPGDLVLATGNYRAKNLIKQAPLSLREVDIPNHSQVSEAFKKSVIIYLVACRIPRSQVVATFERRGPTGVPHRAAGTHVAKAPIQFRSPEQLRSSFNDVDERALPTTLRRGVQQSSSPVGASHDQHHSHILQSDGHRDGEMFKSENFQTAHGGGKRASEQFSNVSSMNTHNQHDASGGLQPQNNMHVADGPASLRSPGEMSLPCGPPRRLTEEWIPYLGSTSANKSPFLATFTPSHNAAMMSVSD